MPSFANGIQLIAPQAVAIVNEEAVVGNQPASSIVVALIASSDGGKPLDFVEVYNYTQAKALYRSGTMTDLLRRLYGPAQTLPGAYKVLCYRVNNAAQATGVAKDSSASTVISLASRDYGLHTNQIRFKIEPGSSTGYKASVQGYDGSATLSRDNISRDMIAIQYTGAGSACALSITSSQLTTSVTGAAGDNVSLDFTSYPAIQNLADALIGTGKYSVTVKADSRTPSATLDYQTSLDIKTTSKTLTANTQSVIDWFNNEEPYVVATRATGAALATMTAFQSLTGGTNGASVSTSDYQTALTALQSKDVNIVLVGTDDAAVHSMVDAHCQLMSQVGANKERLGIVGGAAGETVDAAVTRAKNLNSFRVALAYPGLLDTDTTGTQITLSPVHTAAAIAGILAGGSIGQPATRKPIRCVGPARNLVPSEIDQLLLGGVMPVQAHDAEGARVVQSILTYNQTATGALNLLRREVSSRLAADVLIRRVRGRLDQVLIGTAGGPLLREQARSVAETVLKEAEVDGLIVGDEARPAFSDLAATISGETITVSFRASIVTPGNYIVLRASLSSFNG